MIITTGKAYEQRGEVYIKTNRPAVDNLSDEVSVCWQDKRLRTLEQNSKAWVLMGSIAAAAGSTKRDVYDDLRVRFSVQNLEALQGRLFHLSEATVTEARDFISLLIDIALEYGVEPDRPLYELCDDIERYVYACLMNKLCAVCQLKADLHHVDQIGMGYNRNTKPQLGDRVLPLCREHHQQYHQLGWTAFSQQYHLTPVRMDERIAKLYIPKKAARMAG